MPLGKVAEAYQKEIREHIKETTWEKCYLVPYTWVLEMYQGKWVSEISSRQIETMLKRMKDQGRSKKVVVGDPPNSCRRCGGRGSVDVSSGSDSDSFWAESKKMGDPNGRGACCCSGCAGK